MNTSKLNNIFKKHNVPWSQQGILQDNFLVYTLKICTPHMVGNSFFSPIGQPDQSRAVKIIMDTQDMPYFEKKIAEFGQVAAKVFAKTIEQSISGPEELETLFNVHLSQHSLAKKLPRKAVTSNSRMKL